MYYHMRMPKNYYHGKKQQYGKHHSKSNFGFGEIGAGLLGLGLGYLGGSGLIGGPGPGGFGGYGPGYGYGPGPGYNPGYGGYGVGPGIGYGPGPGVGYGYPGAGAGPGYGAYGPYQPGPPISGYGTWSPNEYGFANVGPGY
jgi:hypothetical protein